MRILWALSLLAVMGCSGGEAGTPPPPAAPSPAQPAQPAQPSPPAAPAAPSITWEVHGTLNDFATFTGTFLFDPNGLPQLGANDTRLYALIAWDIVVPASALHPALHFTNTQAGQTAQLCIGVCVNGEPAKDHLFFDNGATDPKTGAQRLQLEFLQMDGVPVPTSLSEWGAAYLPGCWLRDKEIATVVHEYIGFLTVPQLSERSPIP